jgi:hypothetical protein
MYRQISSWVGDHQRIPAVVCFYFIFEEFLGVVVGIKWSSGPFHLVTLRTGERDGIGLLLYVFACPT